MALQLVKAFPAAIKWHIFTILWFASWLPRRCVIFFSDFLGRSAGMPARERGELKFPMGCRNVAEIFMHKEGEGLIGGLQEQSWIPEDFSSAPATPPPKRISPLRTTCSWNPLAAALLLYLIGDLGDSLTTAIRRAGIVVVERRSPVAVFT